MEVFLQEAMDWIYGNREWLFSGAGVVVFACIGRLLFRRLSTSSTQSIWSGDNSTNLQAGRDASMTVTRNEDDVGQR